MKDGIPAPTGAIDWASASHTGAVVDHEGRLVARYEFAHSAEGLVAMLRRFTEHGVEGVAIERPDGPVVNALLDSRLTVFVISPRQVKHLRCRYGSAGNKDDAYDAFVLADVLRTDRHRLRPLERDGDTRVFCGCSLAPAKTWSRPESRCATSYWPTFRSLCRAQ